MVHSKQRVHLKFRRFIAAPMPRVWAALLLTTAAFVDVGCSSLSGPELFESIDRDRHAWTPLENSLLDAGYVNWHNVASPLNRYTLIREGGFLCGIRFVNFRRGQDRREGSIWSSGEETLSSAYEWYVFAMDGPRVRVQDHGRAVVRFTAPRGFGHLIIAGGYESIRCGSRQFGWQYPAGVVFSQALGSDRQIAPTRWERVIDINLSDPKLVWYSGDPKRKSRSIPLEDL